MVFIPLAPATQVGSTREPSRGPIVKTHRPAPKPFAESEGQQCADNHPDCPERGQLATCHCLPVEFIAPGESRQQAEDYSEGGAASEAHPGIERIDGRVRDFPRLQRKRSNLTRCEEGDQCALERSGVPKDEEVERSRRDQVKKSAQPAERIR